MRISKRWINAIVLTALALSTSVTSATETDRDCLLEGIVRKSGTTENADTQVNFYSVKKYDDNAKCRIRRSKKLEFKLPDDPRLRDAPDGSSVKYRHQRSKQGEVTTELINVST